MHDAGANDRTIVYYTMMTHATPPIPGSSHAHAHTHTSSHGIPHSPRHSKPSKAGPAATSPRNTFPAGQVQPPKLSPGRAAEAKASSPNYFGLVVDSTNDGRESSGPGRNRWSPPSSSVRSFAAAIPTQLPVDANPEFDAFRRQADLNRGKSFSLPTAHWTPTVPSNVGPIRPQPSRYHTHASDTGSDMSHGRALTSSKDRQTKPMDMDQDSMNDSAYVSSESKRNSESSLFPLQLGGITTTLHESPGPMEGVQHRTTLTRTEDRDPRLSMMEHKIGPPSPKPGDIPRASTLPMNLDNTQPSMISPEELKTIIKNGQADHVLLLDIRSSQNYAQSRIQGALNLCIPTTLLKRATFNTAKLQQTFQNDTDVEKFSKWQSMQAVIVYDSHSSDKRDAITAVNMIKKFTNEGYSGKTCIVRGGFGAFSEAYSNLIDRRSASEMGGRSGGCSLGSGLAPVIGGVMLPTTSSEPNAFFSNIRQNIDLADGVGQFEIARPEGLESPKLPQWLRETASQSDKGKAVSDKFLHIEKSEKSRMQNAYAAFNPKFRPKERDVQLCGVEKGGKNRYKDILPFEHARVKLSKPHGSCDYVNASHLQTVGSNKKYIATQGPLPATFEDFWSVIWEQDVRVIVMLTAESEGGQLKCHSYWKEKDFGPLKLKPLSEKTASLEIDKRRSDSNALYLASEGGRKRAATLTSASNAAPVPQPRQIQNDVPHVVIRKFALSHTAEPFAPIREITQLHYSSWPDLGTPAEPAHLLALIELANVMQRAAMPLETTSVVDSRQASDHQSFASHEEPEANPKARPMLVHCSAGCGRTGAFCTVDSVLDMMKRQRMAQRAAKQARDSEGDVSMSDAADTASPRKDGQFEFPIFVSNDFENGSIAPTGSLPQDVSWVGNESVDLVDKAVHDFREQRLSTVQSLRQFTLCYETILEWVHRMNNRGTIAVGRARARSGSLQIST